MLTTHSPLTTEEKLTRYFISKMRAHGGHHVTRFEASVGPLVWKLTHLPGVTFYGLSHTQQVRFDYHGHTYKARFSHGPHHEGQLEIVEVHGVLDAAIRVTIRNLDDAMTVDLAAELG